MGPWSENTDLRYPKFLIPTWKQYREAFWFYRTKKGMNQGKSNLHQWHIREAVTEERGSFLIGQGAV